MKRQFETYLFLFAAGALAAASIIMSYSDNSAALILSMLTAFMLTAAGLTIYVQLQTLTPVYIVLTTLNGTYWFSTGVFASKELAQQHVETLVEFYTSGQCRIEARDLRTA